MENEKELLGNKQVPQNEEKKFDPLDFIMSDEYDLEELKRRAPLAGEDRKIYDLLSSKEIDLDKVTAMMEKKLKDFQKDTKGTKDTNPFVITGKLSLARLHHDNGQYGKAVKILERQVEPARVCFAEAPSVVLLLQSKLGMVYQDMGCYEKAEKIFREVIDSTGKRLGSENEIVLENQTCLKIVYWLWGGLEESTVLEKRILEMKRKKRRKRRNNQKNDQEWNDNQYLIENKFFPFLVLAAILAWYIIQPGTLIWGILFIILYEFIRRILIFVFGWTATTITERYA